MTTLNVQRPYVGKDALDIAQVKQVSDKKLGDVTSPGTPVVARAWAFELAADGSNLVPPPPPAQPGVALPRRDPLVIELNNIEIGSRIELVSLSDNPRAEFSADYKGEIFELPLTGYDVQNRTATIALNEEQMKDKNIVAGERFMLRQVDKDGNASEAVHVFLDPQGWARSNINEPLSNGSSHVVRGDTININTGITGLQGNPNPGKMEQVLGKTTVDANAPKLVEAGVSITSASIDAKDFAVLTKLWAVQNWLVGGNNYTLAELSNWVTTNKASYEQNNTNIGYIDLRDGRGQHNTTYAELYALAKDVAAVDPKVFERLAAFTNHISGDRDPSRINFNAANSAVSNNRLSITTIKFDRALEPGVSINVQNSRTGDRVPLTLGANERTITAQLGNVLAGDPIIITFADAAGNAGAPYAFNFDPNAKDGKAAKQNPLNLRLSGFNIAPKPAKPEQTT